MAAFALLPGSEPPPDRTVTPRSPRQGGWWRGGIHSISWFSGADPKLLAKVPSEQNFHRRLGAAVLLLSCLSGLGLCFSLGYVLDTDPAGLWWAGLGWAAFMACGVEPLVLQLSSTKNWLVFSLAVLWRVVLSILLALQLSEPLILAINQPEIDKQMQTERSEARGATISRAKATYTPQIKGNLAELREIRSHVADLEHRNAEYRYQVAEAAQAGVCGPKCTRYGALARSTTRKLEAAGERNGHRQLELHRQLDRWRSALYGDIKEGKKSIGEGDGIWARIDAMNAVAATHPGMAAEVWVLRLLFVVLDLLPLTAKVFRLFTIDSPYEDQLAAARALDAVPAKKAEADARVREAEISQQERADKEVLRARINRETDRRIYEMDGDSDFFAAGGTQPYWHAERVRAKSLGELGDEIQIHDHLPVPVPGVLRRVGFVGLGVLGSLLVLLALSGATAGLWLIAVAFAAATALCAYTQGFRRASPWGMRGILATFLVGLVMPLLLIAINV